MLSQNGLRLKSGWSSLAFYARSSTGQSINVAVESNGNTLWQADVRLPDPSSDIALKHYYFVFETPAVANATLRFRMGQNVGMLWLDAVHVCAAPPKLNDEFNGAALDASRWTHCAAYSGNCAVVDGTNQVEWHKPGNVTVSAGTAKLAFTRETGMVCVNCAYGEGYNVTRNYAGSYIQTSNSFTTTYGTFEARIKLPRSGGLWPAWWMLPAAAANGAIVWPPEINVHEFFSSRPRESVQTVHFNTPTQFNATDGNQYLHPSNLNGEFHVFSANWTPDEIIWYVDGMEVFRSTVYSVHTPMYLILNVGSGDLSGPPDADLSQAVTEVDYVRVFDNSAAFAFDVVVGSTPTPTHASTPTAIASPNATATVRPTQLRYLPLAWR